MNTEGLTLEESIKIVKEVRPLRILRQTITDPHALLQEYKRQRGLSPDL